MISAEIDPDPRMSMIMRGLSVASQNVIDNKGAFHRQSEAASHRPPLQPTELYHCLRAGLVFQFDFPVCRVAMNLRCAT